MSVPLSQMLAVSKYVLGKRLRGVKRYPLVLMLEPLLRCNLACAGCGKIQHPPDILRRQLSVDECLGAVDECDTPIVSIPGGEPLMHPDIAAIVDGIVQRKKYTYLCTNALLLEQKLVEFNPSQYLAFSIHLDGPRADHDRAVCRKGVYDQAIGAIRAARSRGFRVTTNTTLFSDADPARMRQFFDELTDLGVEGMMISPGYSYPKAPDQDHFLARKETRELFRRILHPKKRSWKFNQTPLFLEFLQGRYELDCTPWGNPTFNVFGWQRPCYLVDEGYCQSFDELLRTTSWDHYGHRSGNPKCSNCLVHSGFEPSAVDATFGSWNGLVRSFKLQVSSFKLRP